MNLLKLFMQLSTIVTHALLLFLLQNKWEKVTNDLKRVSDEGSELKKKEI